MKKLFSIGVLTLVMSCQSGTEEITSKPETTIHSNLVSKTKLGAPSDAAILNSVSEYMEANRLPGSNGAIINCHTEYNTWDWGHACVTVGAYNFKVRWHGGTELINGNWVDVIHYYPGEPVSSCGC